MKSFGISFVVQFIAYALLQVVFLNDIALFGKAFCFAYVGFLLMVPLDTDRIVQLIIGFLFGFTIDIFYNTLGLHTMAATLLMFLRPSVQNMIVPSGGYENIKTPSIKNLDGEWFFYYSIPLIFVHHFVLFYVENGGFQFFFPVLWKVIFSTLFTYITLLIIQQFFYSKARII